jgi:hypothetical protein
MKTVMMGKMKKMKKIKKMKDLMKKDDKLRNNKEVLKELNSFVPINYKFYY